MCSKEVSKDLLMDEDEIEKSIVMDAKNGDVRAQEYIISKYESFVKAKAKSYFLIGADKEDIYQEGMIGLYKAIRDINFEKATTFKAFAELCVTRQIITAIKKNLPLPVEILQRYQPDFTVLLCLHEPMI